MYKYASILNLSVFIILDDDDDDDDDDDIIVSWSTSELSVRLVHR